MLNSAAGVTLPIADRAAHQHDPLEPAPRAPDSGPGAARRSSADRSRRASRAPGCAGDRVGDPVDRVPGDAARARRAAGRGRRGPSRRGRGSATNGSRTSGRRAPATTGTSSRPRWSSTRIAFAVVLSQRLVPGDRGDAEQLDLGAREREHQRDRVIVPGVAVEDDRASRRECPLELVRRRQRGLRAQPRRGDRARRRRRAGAPRRARGPPAARRRARHRTRRPLRCRRRPPPPAAAARATSRPSSSSTAPSRRASARRAPGEARWPRTRSG